MRAQDAYRLAVEERESLQAAYGDSDALLLKAPGENSNKGMTIYVACAASLEDDPMPLADWLVTSSQRLRSAVAILQLSGH